MSFLYPVFLVGALAVAIPILLHLLRRETDVRVPFSAVRFLRHAPVEVAHRRRLRELILLALRVSALALLALAFARPFLSRGIAAGTSPLTVVAIDTSYSLTAPGQFERARQLARRAIDEAPASHLVSLIAFDDDARVVAMPEARASVLAKLAGVRPGYGRTRYRAALSRAAEIFGLRGGKLVVVTDLQQVGWDGGDTVTFGPGVEVEVADVGPPSGNLAITAFRLEEGRPAVSIRNLGLLLRTGQVRLEVDGRQLAEMPFTIGPGTSATLNFALSLPATGTARATIEDGNGYAADNVRYLVLDPPRARAILAITGSNPRGDAFYLERALQVDETSRFRVELVAASAVARLDPAALRKFASIFLLGSQGLDLRGAEHLAGFVKSGGGLMIAAGARLDQVLVQALFGALRFDGAWEGRTAPVSLVPANVHHPILRPFGPLTGTLSNVQFRQTAALPEHDRWQVIARFSNGKPALVESTLGEGRILLFASDLSNRGNDFPLHPGFVPLIHEAARYLGAVHEHPSELVPAEVPAGMKREPGIIELPADARDRRGGAAMGSEGRRVAVNVDINESEVSRLDAGQFAAAITRSSVSAKDAARTEARQIEEQQNLWRYGLMLMIVALAAELVVGRAAA
ncbi:MAG: BatA domain-containing protein [Acidobacteria bacterium]|nr:BatA domain-containing protein [Acidobacteriota bacterium]